MFALGGQLTMGGQAAPITHTKMLAKKHLQYKGEPKEYKKWRENLLLYMNAAALALMTDKEKELFTFSLMQEGEAQQFVHNQQADCIVNIYNWDECLQEMDKQFLNPNLEKDT